MAPYLEVTNGELSADGGLTWTTSTVNYVTGFTWVRASLTSSTAYKPKPVNQLRSMAFPDISCYNGKRCFVFPSDPTSDEYYHYIEGRMREFSPLPPVLDLSRPFEISHSGMSAIHYFWRSPITAKSPWRMTPWSMCGNQHGDPNCGNEEHLGQVFDIAIDTTDADDEFRAALTKYR